MIKGWTLSSLLQNTKYGKHSILYFYLVNISFLLPKSPTLQDKLQMPERVILQDGDSIHMSNVRMCPTWTKIYVALYILSGPFIYSMHVTTTCFIKMSSQLCNVVLIELA